MKTRMWIDPIVDEVHRVREELARETGCDVTRLGARLLESQKRHGAKLVSRPPQRIPKSTG